MNKKLSMLKVSMSMTLLLIAMLGIGTVSATLPAQKDISHNSGTSLSHNSENKTTIYVISVSNGYGFLDAKAYQVYDGKTNEVRLPRNFDILDFRIKNGDTVQWNNVGAYDCDAYNCALAIVGTLNGMTAFESTTLYLGWGYSHNFAENGVYDINIYGTKFHETIKVGRR